MLQDLKFFQLLFRIDQELAAQARVGGCLFCDGVLHCADYPRKPRACLSEVQDAFSTRFSFCCNLCRKRCTAMSVRFLGRRVYLGLAVVLGSARHAGQIPAAARLSEALTVPIRTLERWRKWWREQFPLTLLWQAQCARFMPPVALLGLPGELLDRFAGKSEAPLLRLLVFLLPLSIRPQFANREGR
ncbi:MAG: hypothetical protein WCJ66_19555 [Verrucomicrobiota bacterium]